MASLPDDNNELNPDSAHSPTQPEDLEDQESSNGDNYKSNVVTANICSSNHTFSVCSPIGLSSSYKPGGAARSILKPSTLFTDANVSSPSVTFGSHASKGVKLKPSILANPFANSSAQISSGEVKLNCNTSSESATNCPRNATQNEDAKTSSSAPLFVPLSDPMPNSTTNVSSTSSPTGSVAVNATSSHQSANTPANSAANSISSAFVFGQNLLERVTMEKDNDQEPATQNEASFSEMLFSSAIKHDKEKDNISHEFSNGNAKTLSVSAKEYEEARSVKRKYEEVAVVTGEEDEENILQMNCKLFAFDNTLSSWKERGRGTLRVNDKDSPEGRSSRLVVRLVGNLRVVLNTKVWGDMNVELVSQKSVRLTAIDSDGQVRIYLVTVQPTDAKQLYNVLTSRIQKKKLRTLPDESHADSTS